MVLKTNFNIYIQKQVDEIKLQLTIGSEFQKITKLDNDKIEHMKVIFNDWVELDFKERDPSQIDSYQDS